MYDTLKKAEVKVYIANLGAYNEGRLVGKWVTLPVTETELQEVFADIMLGWFDAEGKYTHGFYTNHSYYEEYAIHDYEAPFKISEYESLDLLNEIAGLEDLNSFYMLYQACDCNLNEALKAYYDGDYYTIQADTFEDLGRYIAHEYGYMRDTEDDSYYGRNLLLDYVDFTRFGKDWFDDDYAMHDVEDLTGKRHFMVVNY